MAEQIECVGGPLDGMVPFCLGDVFELREFNRQRNKTILHIYHYNPTTNTYEYKGVRK